MGSSHEAAKYWQSYTKSLVSDAKTHAANYPHAAEHFNNAATHGSEATKHFGSLANDDDGIKSLNHAEKHYRKGLKAAGIKEELIIEGKKATPLKGHPYHEKTDAELHYILRDAGEAARVGKGLSSEGKYLDQMNDAATVLYHRRNGGKQIVKPTNEELELDEIAKATLDRYRHKAKAKFRAKGGINAALEKQDKERPRKKAANEEIEPLDELSPKVLKSYVKKATTSAQRAWDKGDKEEDKSMSTDGYKYPEKQARHQRNATAQHKVWAKRDTGLTMAKKKLRKEDLHLVDRVMIEDEPDASAYIEGIELRCNSLVDERKAELAKTMFDFKGK